jgi:3-oxoacid CoA-transferase
LKTVPQLTPLEAARLVKDGDVIMVGGFGMTGTPVHLLHALAQTNVKHITYIANNMGEPGLGGGRMLRNGQIKKAIGSYFTSNPEAVAAAQSGAIEFELIPQGSLAEAIRAGGAGLGGFYTPTAAGTVIAQDRETKNINGKPHVFVPALRADVALIRAWTADAAGNLVYRMTEQNFNKAMATAAAVVIAEAETIVPVGDLDPNHIHTPGNYVDYLVQAHTTLEDLGSSASVKVSNKKVSQARMAMARRALAELKRGEVVNLGIGIPTLVADLITPEYGIILHTENGMLGLGPAPEDGGAMDYPVNASKVPVTALAGSSYFDSADSFAMIRGGHVDVAIMGGLQVDEQANLANWAVPGKPLLGVGGAMDLASGARRLIVTMTHTDDDGAPKIVPICTLPLTAVGAVDTVITDLAVFKFFDGKLTLIELMPGATLDEVRAGTAASFATNSGEPFYFNPSAVTAKLATLGEAEDMTTSKSNDAFGASGVSLSVK